MRGERTGFRWATALAAALAVTGLVAVSGVAATGGVDGVPAPAAFRLEDGTVGCVLLDASRLACRAADGAAAALTDDGASSPTDADVSWDDSTPVLLPAESWWNGAFSCRVAGAGVACSAGDGAIEVGLGSAGGVR
jgi:hypothetical protein